MSESEHTPALAAPSFYPWRDAYGREHADIPRCMGATSPRHPWMVKGRVYRDCQRRGVVKRATDGAREYWFCLQHDPAKRDERRIGGLAPAFLDLLRQALDLMPANEALRRTGGAAPRSRSRRRRAASHEA